LSARTLLASTADRCRKRCCSESSCDEDCLMECYEKWKPFADL